MSKGKIVAFSLIAAALLSWQIASVNTATSGASGIVDACASDANSAGGCWFSCPLGDADRLDEIGAVISIHADDGAGGIANIPATDFYLLGCTDGLVLCGGGGSINADSASNASGNTTMSGDLAASGCDLDGIVVVIQGTIVEEGTPPNCTPKCLPFDAVTPDITGDGGVIDGAVDAIDFGRFGQIYTGDLPFDACYDYNCDGQCELADFGDFGLHWEHSCQGGN
jgi:hypothetical protein